MITLMLGGASSGKSLAAEQCALALRVPVTYVATWRPGGDERDPAMEERVARHRGRRPSSWASRELGMGESLGEVLLGVSGPVLLDALGTWVAGSPGFHVDVAGLCTALVGRAHATIVVSDEVGMGVHPSTSAGREFRESMGRVNEAVAAVADDVWLVVAGRALRLDHFPWSR